MTVCAVPGNTGRVIDEHAVRRPGERLRPYVAWCTGYRQAGIEPAAHRGLPSPWLTMIVTLDEPLVIARHPDPRQPASTHDFLLGGLHTAAAAGGTRGTLPLPVSTA
jgi:hypothetical protein